MTGARRLLHALRGPWGRCVRQAGRRLAGLHAPAAVLAPPPTIPCPSLPAFLGPFPRRAVLGLLWLAFLHGAALAAEPTPDGLAGLRDSVHAWVQSGYDRPEQALEAFDALQRQWPDVPGRDRVLDLGRGMVQAAAGRHEAVQPLADRLARVSVADAALVRALAADVAGHGSVSVQLAETALAAYASECPETPPAPVCDHRPRWFTQQMLARLLLARGRSSRALQEALAAAELASGRADAAGQALALSLAARAADAVGRREQADRHATEAMRIARLDGTPRLLARMALFEGWHLTGRGEREAARRASEQGLPWARRAQSPRLEALLLTNIADSHVHAGRPQQALRAIERALPVVRMHRDRRAERVLLANAGLARIGLGQLAAARRTVDELVAAFEEAGASADQAVLLHEFGDALAHAGDLRGALDLYHRERRLKAELTALNRDAALAELRGRHDRAAQQRKMELLERDNALIGARLRNAATEQRVWLALGAALLLAVLLAALLYRRVRHINQRLAQNQHVLRLQCERDPLTGLANRRVMAQRWGPGSRPAGGAPEPGFEGTLVLVDIDHFKRINDAHGHAAGDAVLVEVARRLQGAVRGDDLVVRWGGEEFLIHAPGLDAAGTRALAERVLLAIASTPVALPALDAAGEHWLRVTASLGFARFPLAPGGLPLCIDRAINLVDMALYTAKNLGRQRGVGIVGVRAADDAALQAIEADFDAARHDGRLQCEELLPALPSQAAAAPALQPA